VSLDVNEKTFQLTDTSELNTKVQPTKFCTKRSLLKKNKKQKTKNKKNSGSQFLFFGLFHEAEVRETAITKYRLHTLIAVNYGHANFKLIYISKQLQEPWTLHFGYDRR